MLPEFGINALTEIEGDIFIGALGYEKRSTFLARKFHSNYNKKICFSFASTGLLSFDDNLKFAKDKGFEISSDLRDSAIFSILKTVIQSGKPKQITIDISSMTRGLLSNVLRSTLELCKDFTTNIQFVYSPAKFLPPPEELPTFSEFHLLSGFEGWTQYPERPVSTIFGLGYEPDQALGAIEFLDPSAAWAYMPVGEDERYEKEVMAANLQLVEYIGNHRIIRYAVKDPVAAYFELKLLAEAALANSRVDLIPGGPKIFSLLCMLLKLTLGPEVSVWRISSHQDTPPVDRKSDGTLAGLEVTVGKNGKDEI